LHWALTHQRIGDLKAPRSLSAKCLKDTVAKYAKVPGCYLNVVIGERYLEDSDVLEDVCTEDPTTLLVAKRMPDETELLHLMRGQISHGGGYISLGRKVQKEDPDVDEAIKFLIDNELGLNDKDLLWNPMQDRGGGDEWAYRNCTILHYSAIAGDANVCQWLLDADNFSQANATCIVPLYNRRDFYTMFAQHGCTALHCAAAGEHCKVINVLLEHRRFTAVADATSDGWNALHMAADLCHQDIALLLLEDGRTAIDATNSLGHTCMDIALRNAETEVKRNGGTADYQMIMFLAERYPKDHIAIDQARAHLSSSQDVIDPLAESFAEAKEARDNHRALNKSKDRQRSERKAKQAENIHKHRQAHYQHEVRICQADSRATAGRVLLARALSFTIPS